MAHTSKGTIFYHYVGDGGSAVATQIYGMMTKPTIPGKPNTVESTSQEDEVQNFADGVIQLGDQDFQFKYEDYGASKQNVDVFMEQEQAKKHVRYGIKYPHGKANEWEAIPFVQFDGTGVNVLDVFTVSMQKIKNLQKNIAAPNTIAQPD